MTAMDRLTTSELLHVEGANGVTYAYRRFAAWGLGFHSSSCSTSAGTSTIGIRP